jgi:hypothetical protein
MITMIGVSGGRSKKCQEESSFSATIVMGWGGKRSGDVRRDITGRVRNVYGGELTSGARNYSVFSPE